MPSDLYAQAGVDIDAGSESLRRIKPLVRSTFTDIVVGDIGSFGGMIDLQKLLARFPHPILVQSIDSVGTKLNIATAMGIHETVGIDMVSHSCGDVLAQGATPLTFMDYFAASKLKPEHLEAVMRGIAAGCRDAGVAIIGGETAELPGIYAKNEYDLVGAVLGVVDKSKVIDASRVAVGDAIIGLASSGLHTNGYSLARKIVADAKLALETEIPELGRSIGAALLEPHRNYTKHLLPVFEKYHVHGVAHITGGGLLENVVRVLPDGMAANIWTASWTVPPLFSYLVEQGKVSRQEAFRVWNMGIGLTLIVAPEDAAGIKQLLATIDPQLLTFDVGEVVAGEKKVNLI